MPLKGCAGSFLFSSELYTKALLSTVLWSARTRKIGWCSLQDTYQSKWWLWLGSWVVLGSGAPETQYG